MNVFQNIIIIFMASNEMVQQISRSSDPTGVSCAIMQQQDYCSTDKCPPECPVTII